MICVKSVKIYRKFDLKQPKIFPEILQIHLISFFYYAIMANCDILFFPCSLGGRGPETIRRYKKHEQV